MFRPRLGRVEWPKRDCWQVWTTCGCRMIVRGAQLMRTCGARIELQRGQDSKEDPGTSGAAGAELSGRTEETG